MAEFKIKIEVRDMIGIARDKLIAAVDGALNDLAQSVEQHAVENINAWGIGYLGRLADSITHDISVELSKTTSVGALHGAWIEYGTGPAAGRGQYWPPHKPIKEWAIKKLGVSPAEADRVAWAIRWHIYKHGTQPKPFFRTALEQGILEWPEIVERHAAGIS